MKPVAVQKQTGKLRIIGGNWRRHHLPVANVPGLRPTTDRLREVLFSWLGPDGCVGSSVLDLFSGTGALGLEAASRGAKVVTFVESHPKVAQQLQGNINFLQSKWQSEWGAPPELRLVKVPVGRFIGMQPKKYDLVFLDPPFCSDALSYTLPRLAVCLKAGGLFYIEWGQPLGQCASSLAQLSGGKTIEVLKYKRLGAVHAHLLQFV